MREPVGTPAAPMRGMHRDLVRDAEILEEMEHEPRGEMACVADPDACGDAEVLQVEERSPETPPETPPPSLRELDRARFGHTMAVWPELG